jgi:type IV secretory pathway protease TraF
MRRVLIAAAAAAGLGALVAPMTLRPSPVLLWNATASAPIGLYLVHARRTLAVGDWVAARPPAGFATLFAERRYLPLGVSLVKRIAAISPQRVCRFGGRVSVDQRTVAWARSDDKAGRLLPAWSGCRRLRRGELLMLNSAPDSLDGRYFGPNVDRDIVGRLTPLWIVRGAPR